MLSHYLSHRYYKLQSAALDRQKPPQLRIAAKTGLRLLPPPPQLYWEPSADGPAAAAAANDAERVPFGRCLCLAESAVGRESVDRWGVGAGGGEGCVCDAHADGVPIPPTPLPPMYLCLFNFYRCDGALQAAGGAVCAEGAPPSNTTTLSTAITTTSLLTTASSSSRISRRVRTHAGRRAG